MGAWIEIWCIVYNTARNSVAPLVGAWIEILNAGTYYYKELTVAPLVGAWIEISLTEVI